MAEIPNHIRRIIAQYLTSLRDQGFQIQVYELLDGDKHSPDLRVSWQAYSTSVFRKSVTNGRSVTVSVSFQGDNKAQPTLVFD